METLSWRHRRPTSRLESPTNSFAAQSKTFTGFRHSTRQRSLGKLQARTKAGGKSNSGSETTGCLASAYVTRGRAILLRLSWMLQQPGLMNGLASRCRQGRSKRRRALPGNTKRRAEIGREVQLNLQFQKLDYLRLLRLVVMHICSTHCCAWNTVPVYWRENRLPSILGQWNIVSVFRVGPAARAAKYANSFHASPEFVLGLLVKE